MIDAANSAMTGRATGYIYCIGFAQNLKRGVGLFVANETENTINRKYAEKLGLPPRDAYIDNVEIKYRDNTKIWEIAICRKNH